MTKKACLLLIAAMLIFSITINGLAAENGTIEVTVRDENDNKPIEGVKISVLDIKANETFIIKTDEKGIARKDCAPGNYVVFDTSKEGYVTIGTNYRMSIIKNDINRIYIYLNVLPKISGTVLDQNGKGVESASVQLVPRGQADILTDSSGKFDFKYDPINIQQYFIARHIKRNLAGSMQFRSGIEGNEQYTKDMNVDIKLEPGFTLKGKVTDPNNRAIPNAWVEADISTGSGAVVIAKCQVDENGQYSINALPVGHRCYIRAGRDGYGVMLKSLGEISTYQESIQVETITLQEANQIVSGIVVDANGNSVEDARILCHGEGQPERETKTDSDGKFIIRNVCKAPLQMAAIKGPMVTNVRTEGGVKDLKIVLNKAPMIIPGTYPVNIKETPRTLIDKPLPQLDKIESTLNDSQLQQKSILLCFFDIEQRPSRNCVLELSKKAKELKEKDIEIIAIQSSKIEQEYLDKWLEENNISFPVKIIQDDEKQIRKNFGIQALPWLILTDNNHVVTAEGFGISELEEKIGIITFSDIRAAIKGSYDYRAKKLKNSKGDVNFSLERFAPEESTKEKVISGFTSIGLNPNSFNVEGKGQAIINWYQKDSKRRYDINVAKPENYDLQKDTPPFMIPENKRIALDSEKAVYYDVMHKEAYINTLPVRAVNLASLLHDFDISRLYQLGNSDIPELFEIWAKKGREPQITEDIVNEIDCIKLEFTHGEQARTIFWLAPDMSYSLVKGELYLNITGEEELAERYEASYEQSETDDIWVIKTMKYENNQSLIPEIVTVESKNIELGIDISDEIFTFDGLGVPAGTPVYDKSIEGETLEYYYTPALLDKSLPEIKELRIEFSLADVNDKPMFICFFDIEQRPSRNCILELNKNVEELKEKDVTLIAIQASNTDKDSFDDWIKEYNIDIPMGFIETDSEQTRLNWGVKALPWLIMTDKEHIVKAEGFSINELEEKIKALNK